MLYSDINGDNPYKNPLVEDINSVKQSIITIIQTRKQELLFLPEFGMDDDNFVFDLIDDTGALLLFQNIVNNINIWDPRVTIDLQKSYVDVTPDNNAYIANIVFKIQGFNGEFEVNTKV